MKARERGIFGVEPQGSAQHSCSPFGNQASAALTKGSAELHYRTFCAPLRSVIARARPSHPLNSAVLQVV